MKQIILPFLNIKIIANEIPISHINRNTAYFVSLC